MEQERDREREKKRQKETPTYCLTSLLRTFKYFLKKKTPMCRDRR